MTQDALASYGVPTAIVAAVSGILAASRYKENIPVIVKEDEVLSLAYELFDPNIAGTLETTDWGNWQELFEASGWNVWKERGPGWVFTHRNPKT
jgi:hypothetical protein